MGSNQVPALPGGAKISVCRVHGVSRRGEDTVITRHGHRGADGRRVPGVAEHGDLVLPLGPAALTCEGRPPAPSSASSIMVSGPLVDLHPWPELHDRGSLR